MDDEAGEDDRGNDAEHSLTASNNGGTWRCSDRSVGHGMNNITDFQRNNGFQLSKTLSRGVKIWLPASLGFGSWPKEDSVQVRRKIAQVQSVNRRQNGTCLIIAAKKGSEAR